MKKKSDIEKIFLLVLVFCCLFSSTACAELKVFDLVTAKGKPADLPFVKMHMVYQWQAYGGQYVPDAEKNFLDVPGPYLECCYYKNNITGISPEYVSIDFEQWKLYGMDDLKINESIDKYRESLDRIRSVFPDKTKISIYNVGVVPSHSNFKKKIVIKKYEKWKKNNDLLKKLVDDFDFLQPSLYFKKKYDFVRWKRKADEYLSEYRRLSPSKKIYLHLSPQYMSDGSFVPLTLWARAIEYAQQHADGLVVWTFPQKRFEIEWNDYLPWWELLINVSR